ncbi:formamidopyrimidine-DNA glycosylase [Deltaproteobacteria bacterium]|nr:formamidopyrimidine-DNA glycosylase [Deltaproteobacteria bacterium]
MPELPEVDFCGRRLANWTAGSRVIDVEVFDARSVRATRTDRPTNGLVEGEARLREVVLNAPPSPPERHGKRLLWRFGDRALLLHLGMTGRWTRLIAPHAKVRFHLENGTCITFTDPRLLGGIVPTDLDDGPRLLREGLGPDALRDPLPSLPGKRPIKVALMDQAVVAGLGNLHAAEALWRARIDPRAPAGEVVGDRHARLATAIRAQLDLARTLLDGDEEIVYVEDAGAPNPFPLYQRAGHPCPECQTGIERMMQAGRSTYWCPGCQRA